MSAARPPEGASSAGEAEGTPVNSTEVKPRLVRCPGCGGDSIYATSNPYRPFCCERCKNLDIGAWAAEHFRMPAEAPPDEQPFGDPRLQ